MSTHPLVQTGSVTLPTGVHTIKVQVAQISRTTPLFNVAGSQSATTDRHSRFVQGISPKEYVVTGVVKKTGAELYGLSQQSTIDLPSTMNIRADRWGISKAWPLFDHTGSPMSSKGYSHGTPSTGMSVSGHANSGYLANPDTESVSVQTLLQRVGTLTGSVLLSSKLEQGNYQTGGPVPVRFAGQFNGQPTFTPFTQAGAEDDFEWLLGDSVTDPVEATLTLDTGDTSSLTPNVIMYSVQLDCNAKSGGPIRLTARMRESVA